MAPWPVSWPRLEATLGLPSGSVEGVWPKTLRRWLQHRRSLEWLAAALCATPRTIITMDDVTVLAHRTAWRALAAMRPAARQQQPHSLYCDPLCDSKCAPPREGTEMAPDLALAPAQPLTLAPTLTRYWMWMRGIRTNCLMKAHFARHDLHRVDLMGGAAPVHEVLHATQYATPAAGLVPLRLGQFAIVRERIASTSVSPRARSPPAASVHQHATAVSGLAVTCTSPPAAPPSGGTGGLRPVAHWRCCRCTARAVSPHAAQHCRVVRRVARLLRDNRG